MNSNLVLVLIQARFHCLDWSYFVIALATYEKTGRLPGKKGNEFNRLAGYRSASSYCEGEKPSDFSGLHGRKNLEAGPAGKKPNDFNCIAIPPSLFLHLPKIKNRKTPEGTALGRTGRVGPKRANTLSGCRANVRSEHAQLGEKEGLLVIVPEGKRRNKKEHLQLINGSRDLQSAMLPYKSTLLTQESTLTPPGKMRVLFLVVALMEASQCT